MNGIQGLMQAPGQGQPPQAPGQAAPPGQGQPPMPGMQPGMGGAPTGISSDRIPELAKLNEQMLTQLFSLSMSGQIPNPSPISVLAAISEKQKQKQALAAVQGSMVQGQNAQNQQSGTIAQQIMGPLMAQQQQRQQVTRKAAHGGAMHSYADGGIVAFAAGDAVWRKRLLSAGVPETFIVGFEARGASPEQIESEARRAGLLSAQTAPVTPPPEVKRSFLDRVLAQHAESPISQALFGTVARAARGESAGPLLERPVIETLTAKAPPLAEQAAPAPAPAPTTEIPERLKDTRGIPALVAQPELEAQPPASRPDAANKVRPPAATPPAATPAAAAAPQIATPSSQLTDEYVKELEARKQVPEEVARGRAGIEALVREEMQARQQRLAQDRAAAEQRQREAIERAPGVFSPEGLLAIAASIDPRRGYELGSAAKGAFGVMAGQRKAQEEARKEFREFEKAERTEQNLLSQMRTLEAQRQQAIIEGKAEKANQITDKIADVRKAHEAAVRDAQYKAQEFALQAERNRIAAEGVEVQREAAKKPAAEIQVMEYLKKPENFALKEKIESAKRADDRMVKLQEIFSKMTELDRVNMGVKNFDDFLKAVTPTAQKPTGPATGTRENPIKLD